MALIDLITDGTDTINLASATDGFTDKYSYKQQIVEKDVLGEYPLVTERLSVNWNQLDDDERADEHAKLMRLKRKANKWGNKNYREGPVWRKLQSNSEDNPKYMVLTNVRLVELGEQFYGPDTTSKPVVLEITREGAPRLIEPTGSRLEVIPATTVYDYVYDGDENHVTIAPGTSAGQLPGDADALLRIIVDKPYYTSNIYEKFNQITIAKRSADTLAELDEFITYFAPADIDSTLVTGMSLVADASTPGGEYLKIENTSGSADLDVNLHWELGAGNSYQGSFRIIVPIKMVGADDYAHLNTILGLTTAWSRGWEAYVPPGYAGSYQKIYVGDISFVDDQGGRLAATAIIGLAVRLPPNSECHIRALWLVPSDEGVFEARNVVNEDATFHSSLLIIDGERKQMWAESYSNYVYPLVPEPSGQYLTADHQKYTRFYFFRSYWDSTNGLDVIYPYLLNMNVTIEAIPRVKALAS